MGIKFRRGIQEWIYYLDDANIHSQIFKMSALAHCEKRPFNGGLWFTVTSRIKNPSVSHYRNFAQRQNTLLIYKAGGQNQRGCWSVTLSLWKRKWEMVTELEEMKRNCLSSSCKQRLLFQDLGIELHEFWETSCWLSWLFCGHLCISALWPSVCLSVYLLLTTTWVRSSCFVPMSMQVIIAFICALF